MDAARTCTGLRGERGGAFDGPLPCTIDAQGSTPGVFVFDGYSAIGVSSENTERFKKLRSILAAAQFPWMVVADWNISPASLQALAFLVALTGPSGSPRRSLRALEEASKIAAHLLRRSK